MSQTELQKKMQTEINRLGDKLSYETLIKIQVRIQKISEIYSSLKTIKTQVASSDYGLLYEVYFMTMATLYRSLFKGLDKDTKIDIDGFLAESDADLKENHLSLINIADKDLAHLDKNSKSHKVMDADSLRAGNGTVIVSSLVSEDELGKTVLFLSETLLPAIEEATAMAQKRL